MSITNELFTSGTLVSDDSGYTSVFTTAYDKRRSDILLTKSDLESSGFIGTDVFSSMRLYVTQLPGKDLGNIVIGVKHTELSSLVENKFEKYNTFTEVGTLGTLARSSMVVNTWVDFTFSEPYFWNGLSNLIITIITDTADTPGYSSEGEWNLRILSDGKLRLVTGQWGDGEFPFPFDDADPTTYLPNSHVPAVQLVAEDRGSRVRDLYSGVSSSSLAKANPDTNAVYGRSLSSPSSTSSSSPVRIKNPEAPPIATNGLIAYWNSNQGVDGTTWGNIAPGKLGKYNGTLMNGAIGTSDGVYFDGINNYVSIPSIASLDLPTNNITIEVFFKPLFHSADFADKALVTTGFSPSFNHITGKVGTSYLPGGSGTRLNSEVLTLDTVHHLVYRIDLTNKRWDIIVNGISQVLIGDLASSALVWSGKALELGRHNKYTDPYYHLKGYISVVRIYNRAVAEDELAENRLFGTAVGLELAGVEHLAYGGITSSSESLSKPVVESSSIEASVNMGISSTITLSSAIMKGSTALMVTESVSASDSLIIKNSTVSSNSVSSLQASAKSVKNSGVSLVLTGNVVIFPTSIKKSSSSMVAGSVLSVSTGTTRSSQVSFITVSILGVLSSTVKMLNSSLESTSSIEIWGVAVRNSIMGVLLESSTQVSGRVVKNSSGILSSSSHMSISPSTVKDNGAHLESEVTMRVIPTRTSVFNSPTLRSTSSLSSSGQAIGISGGGLHVKAKSSVTLQALVIKGSTMNMESSCGLWISPTKVLYVTSPIRASSRLGTKTILVVSPVSPMNTHSTMNSKGVSMKTCLVEMMGMSSIDVDPIKVRSSLVSILLHSRSSATSTRVIICKTEMSIHTRLEPHVVKMLNSISSMNSSHKLESIGNSVLYSMTPLKYTCRFKIQVNVIRTPGLNFIGTLEPGVMVTALMMPTTTVEVKGVQKEDIGSALRGVRASPSVDVKGVQKEDIGSILRGVMK